ncbi:MAG: hypothetical protein ASARMPRED_005379 [Alectoria sarmentosa]|nr:MAG: hypothetical protein ASARMPRED_005379 [Alectoria sarmentosa]
MDRLSVATSVAGVAAMGVQLSQTIYGLISTFYEAEKEMSIVANDLSLLAMVLNELEGILRRDSRVYRRRMVREVNEILNSCEGVFQSIFHHVSANPHDARSSRQFKAKVRWYFQRHRVRPLQAGLESMKSTLNVLLHVVHMARVIEAAEFYIPNAGTLFPQAGVQQERRILVGVVLDNRQSILSLTEIEKDCDRGQSLTEDKRGVERTCNNLALDDGAPTIERIHNTRETTEGGGFDSIGAWGGGSSSNASPNTSLLQKAAKDSAKDTTYSSNWPIDGNKKVQKEEITIAGFDAEKSGVRDENKKDEADVYEAGDDFDRGCLTTTTEKKHKEKDKDLVDGISNVKDRIVIDPTLGNTEKAADDSWSSWSVAFKNDNEDKTRMEAKKRSQTKVENNGRNLQDAPPDPSVPARSSSRSEDVVGICEVSEAGWSVSRPESFNVSAERGHANEAEDLPARPGSHLDSRSHSPASVYYSMPTELPIMENTEPYHPKGSLAMQASRTEVTASSRAQAAGISQSQASPPETETVTLTAAWFLSVVPHEPSVTALIVRPRSGEAKGLETRAEETAKTLLLNWTNVDPDIVSGEENSGGWSFTDNSYSQSRPLSRDAELPNQPYQMSSTPPAYQTYTPQHWYSPPVLAAPPPPNDKQTDIEDLARLKKLILDEKAEQDMKAAAMAAAATPTAPVAPIATEEFPEDTMQRENTYMEAVDSMEMAQEHNRLWKAEPPRLAPVIMRDWLGRKFLFPVAMCQTWQGLHNLIQEAFGHVLEFWPLVEKGYYNISHVTGEIILPSTWKSFVQPGLEVNMEIWNASDADRDNFGGTMVGDRREKVSPRQLIPPHTPEVVTLGGSVALRSRNDNESSVGDIADNETESSFPDGTSFVERSDSRYMSIENALLEQKKAKIEAEMKLERNRRFFHLKQQLVDQGAAIQARQDAADHAEQDTKLAWLEKQVRDQKEELDGLPPLLMTLPSSNACDSFSTSAGSPQRRPSFGARLLGRMPSRSIRSKGSIQSQQMITDV